MFNIFNKSNKKAATQPDKVLKYEWVFEISKARGFADKEEAMAASHIMNINSSCYTGVELYRGLWVVGLYAGERIKKDALYDNGAFAYLA